jgi:hypothetical protein
LHWLAALVVPNLMETNTQFYFPGEKANLTDEFFHWELVMQVVAADDALRARFDAVLAMR